MMKSRAAGLSRCGPTWPLPFGRNSLSGWLRLPSASWASAISPTSTAGSFRFPSGAPWVMVWFPSQWPSASTRSASARTPGSARWLPVGKNVACRSRSLSTSRTRSVTPGVGPWSKVRVSFLSATYPPRLGALLPDATVRPFMPGREGRARESYLYTICDFLLDNRILSCRHDGPGDPIGRPSAIIRAPRKFQKSGSRPVFVDWRRLRPHPLFTGPDPLADGKRREFDDPGQGDGQQEGSACTPSAPKPEALDPGWRLRRRLARPLPDSGFRHIGDPAAGGLGRDCRDSRCLPAVHGRNAGSPVDTPAGVAALA